MSDEPESAAVTMAYVHSNECTMSFHHSFVNMLGFDMAKNNRVMRGGFVAINCGTNGLVESRNMAISIFLEEKKSDWLFWVDTDMGWLPDTLERLVEAADPVERPIVGALCYSMRQMGADDMGGHRTKLTPTIFDWTTEEGGHKGFAVRFDYARNTLTKCNGTGSACIVIHRSVFEKIKEKHGPIWYDRITNPTTGQLVGEDLSFCMRAGLEGYPIFVHTGIQASHAKTRWLIETDYDDQLMAEAVRLNLEKQTAPVAVIVPVMGRPQNAAPFMESLKASTDKARVYAIVGPEKDAGKSAVAWQKAGAQVRVAQGSTFAEKVNAAYKITTEPWLLLVGDDVRFHPGWLEAAQKVGAKSAVVGTNDLSNPRVLAGEHTCHPLIKRSYIDEMGASWDGPGVVAHTYGHWFVDDEIVTAAKQRGVWGFAPDAIIEHMHPLWGKAEMDATYMIGQSKATADKELFKERLEKYALVKA
jgi:hypothetical protein